MFYTFAIRIIADDKILGNTGDFARKLGIVVNFSRGDEFGFYLDGCVGEEVLATMFRTKIETEERIAGEVQQKIVCFYSQNQEAISRENDEMKKKLSAFKEEHSKGSTRFSFTIGDVYMFNKPLMVSSFSRD